MFLVFVLVGVVSGMFPEGNLPILVKNNPENNIIYC